MGARENDENPRGEDEDFELVEDEEESAQLKSKDAGKLRDELKRCSQERQEYLDGWQRAKADFINTKKRLEGELAERQDQGILECVKSVLPTLDSIHTALTQEQIDGAAREGIELIKKQLLSALKEHRIEEIDPIGEAFNANFHEPVGTIEVTDREQDDRVQETYQRGYKRGSQLIRPAKVLVGTFVK